MDGWRKLLCILPLLMAKVCLAQGDATVNPAWAFDRGGAIVLGKIASVQLEAEDADYESGTVTIEVTEKLRGSDVSTALDFPFAWSDPKSPRFIFSRMKGPPPTGFGGIRPSAGREVLAFLAPRKPTSVPPLEVLDIGAGGSIWVPLVRRAIAIDQLPVEERTQSLLEGLSDPTEFTRDVAMHGLMQGSQCRTGTTCREKAIAILTQRARAGLESERIRSMGWLFQYLYDPSAKNTRSNRQIVSSFFTLVTDPDQNIRRAAIVQLDNVFFSGANWTPEISTLEIPSRTEIISELEKEQKEGWPSAYKAKRIERLIKAAAERSQLTTP